VRDAQTGARRWDRIEDISSYFIEFTSYLHMIYAIAKLNILAILPVESLPSRT